MKICIVGVGAIGGLIGARLAANPTLRISALARGDSLEALRSHGWRLRQGDDLLQTPCIASNSSAELGTQDIIILALKAPALTSVLPTLSPLLGQNTLVISAMNGVPWWFFRDLENQSQRPFQSINPEWGNSNAIPYENTIGAVVHASASRIEAGFIQHKAGNRIILGEPNGSKTARVQSLVELLIIAGFDAIHSEQIRLDIWYKLWGNMTINPISAITGATADKILEDPIVRHYCSAVMEEAAELGRHINCSIEEDAENRHNMTAKLGAFKTSMLQDVENHRMIELDALVGAVQELAQRLNIDTPNINTLFGLTRLFARTKGLY